MPFITPIPIDAIDADVRAMYARQQSHYGYVPAYAQVFCYRPEIMQLWAQLQSGIKKHVDARRYELVTFAAANALRSSLCSIAHGKMLSKFVPTEDVQAIARGETPPSLTQSEAAMLAFARQVARDAAAITQQDVDDLKQQGFTDADVFDIAAIAAARAFWTKVIDSLGSDADTPWSGMGDEFIETMTVGRPPVFVEPERLPEAAA
jgi:uncharacterized peroxidase-related enzyme